MRAGTRDALGCPWYRLSARGVNFTSEPLERVRLGSRQPARTTPRQMASYRTKAGDSRIKVRTHSHVRMRRATAPSTPCGEGGPGSTRHARIFGAPAYFSLVAAVFSGLEQCSRIPTMRENVCAAALVLTSVNFEGAAPLRPCVPTSHLADHCQACRMSTVQRVASM